MNDFSFSVPQNVIAGRGSIADYEGGGKVPGDIVPPVAIPTTAGTGSETTAAACGMDAMADDAMKSGNIAVNPRATAKRDILDLYRKAL